MDLNHSNVGPQTFSEPLNGSGSHGATSEDNELLILLLRGVFELAYAQGQFDLRHGFSSFLSIEDLSKAWVGENADLLEIPIDITRLMSRLHAETEKVL